MNVTDDANATSGELIVEGDIASIVGVYQCFAENSAGSAYAITRVLRDGKIVNSSMYLPYTCRVLIAAVICWALQFGSPGENWGGGGGGGGVSTVQVGAYERVVHNLLQMMPIPCMNSQIPHDNGKHAQRYLQIAIVHRQASWRTAPYVKYCNCRFVPSLSATVTVCLRLSNTYRYMSKVKITIVGQSIAITRVLIN